MHRAHVSDPDTADALLKPTKPTPSPPQPGLLALQKAAGNGAVAAILARQTDAEVAAVEGGDETAAPAMPGPRDGLVILPELDAIYVAMKAAGHPTRIHTGFRTLDEQIQLYAKGRSFATFKRDIEAAVVAGTVPQATCTEWVDRFDPAKGNRPMPAGEPKEVTWKFDSRHLVGEAADVVHATLAWGANPAFWVALNAAAAAQGLQIGPPSSDLAHVQRP